MDYVGALASFGTVDPTNYVQIELTSPAASEQSRKDCEAISKLGLKAKVISLKCYAALVYTNLT